MSGGPDAALERITRLPGVRGAVLASTADGLVVMERLMEGIDGRTIAALVGSLVARLGRATAAAGLQPPRFLQLRGAHGALLAAPGPEDLVLIAVVTAEANVGIARLEMLDAVRGLA